MKVHRIKAAMGITGLPRSTIYLYMKNGTFPKAIKLGERSVGWLESDLLEWIQNRRSKSE
jgi:prophage regulatory protein